MKKSLRIKLIALIAVSIIGLIGTLGIILGWGYSVDQQKKLEHSLSQELQIVSYAASAGLEFNDAKTVEDAVDLLKNVKEFVEVKVLLQDGKVFVRKAFRRSRKDLKSNSFGLSIPVFDNANATIGQIEAVVTEQYFKDDIKSILGMALGLTLGVVVFALLWVGIILREIFRPLIRLKETIDKVSGEGFIGKVDVKSNDEIGELAASFNEMSARIEERTELLQASEKRLAKLNDAFLHFKPDPLMNITLLTALCGEMFQANFAFYSSSQEGKLLSSGLWRVPDRFIWENREGHICCDVIQQAGNELIVLQDLQKTAYAATDPNVLKYDLNTYVVMPVVYGGVCIGSLVVVYKHHFVPSEAEKKILGILSTALGVEESRFQKEEILREAKQKADASSQAKSQFLANMSHETRTPLNAILGFCDMLRTTVIDDKQREYLNTIMSSGNILLAIINDVLDFSKLESGDVQLEIIDFDLGNLVNDVFNIAQIRFEDSRIDPYIDWDARVPQWVKGDPTRVRQILLNFLNNSAKFTKQGAIGVILRLDQQTPQGPVIRFCVKDTGIGIPENKKHILFESFSQVDSSTTRRYGGAGLGLVISKKLVDAMAGKVWFESKEGQGSQFFFTIPFASGTSLVQQPIDPLPKEQLFNKTVLCVDDYKGSLEVVSRYCQEIGLKVVKASSAAEALQKLNDLSAAGSLPDLMLSDVRMPDMDGYIMVEQIRSQPKFNSIKIVATTSDSRIGGAQFAQSKGFNGYLPKPVIRRDLIRIISTVLGDRRMAPSSIITRHMANEVGLKGVKVLVVDDVISNQQLMKAYLTMFGCVSDFASNGQEAVDKLRTGSYDICLMDVQMPVLSGIEATRIIRAEISKDLPIIALTAAVMKEDLARTQESGMNDFLTKPLEVTILKSKLLKYVGSSGARSQNS